MNAPPPDRHLFVVVGATGDLMDRKVLPALWEIHRRHEVAEGSAILGASRRPLSDSEFQETAVRALLAHGAGPEDEVRSWAQSVLRYRAIDGTPEGYGGLADRVREVESEFHLPGNRVLYLALPLSAFTPALMGIARAGLSKGAGWTRVVVEKPFGRDLASARALNDLIHSHFDERDVYRIDHYLGKETVQNLLVLRFANMFLEGLWNRQWVEHVQITVAESLGVEGRVGYYDSAGAIRDMVQNHVTQLLALVAMEVPSAFAADAIRNEKVKVLRSIARLAPEDVVLGQYGPGSGPSGPTPGYVEEPGVAPSSRTETFAALRLRIANWRWQGVPFFLRTGKRMARKSTRIVLTFRAPPISFFPLAEEYELNPDRLAITLQPDEGFDLAFEIKVPGEENRIQTHRMRFRYADVFGSMRDAYETLILDILAGDPTLFVCADEVEASWTLYDDVLRAGLPVHTYAPGANGPPEAARLAEEWGYRWNED